LQLLSTSVEVERLLDLPLLQIQMHIWNDLAEAGG